MFPYTVGCLILPVITLYAGYFGFATVLILISIALFCFDPDFRYYKTKISQFSTFYITVLILGITLALLANIVSDYKFLIISIWWLTVFIWGFKLSGQVDNLGDK